MTRTFLITDTIDSKIPDFYYELTGACEKLGTDNLIIFLASEKKLPETDLKKIKNQRIINLTSDLFKYPDPHLFSEAILERADEKVNYICLPHTMRGTQTAAILHSELKGTLITGVTAIEEEKGEKVFTRDLMNGKWSSKIIPEKYPVIFTIISGAFSGTDNDIEADAEITFEKIDKNSKYRTINIAKAFDDDSSIDDADVVVGAGRGAQSEESMELIDRFTAIFKNSATGGSRPLCDSGVLPYSRQIGETGKKISPKLYIACGISGANQHVSGIKNAQSIIAINKDKRAAIFRTADIGVVGSIENIIPQILELTQSRKDSDK